MRLIELKRKIDFADENFDLKFSSSNGSYFIENVLKCKDAISALIDSQILPSGYEKEDVFIDVVQSSFTNRIIVDNPTYNFFVAISHRIKYMLGCLHGWMTKYIDSEETDTTINIKLPNITNLNDLASTSLMLKKSLSQVVADIGGEVKVKQLDHGSYWVIIDVTTVNAVALIGSLVWGAVKIVKLVIETNVTYQQYVNYKLKNEALLAVKEKNNEIIKSEISKEAEKINQEYFENNDPERRGRISVSIDELCKLIQAGGEVHPASYIEKGNKGEYPDYTKLLFTQKKISEIDHKKESNDVNEENSETTI